jgi:hypothetical protein
MCGFTGFLTDDIDCLAPYSLTDVATRMALARDD